MIFSIFIVYTCELYPSRARALGNGMVSAAGTIASTISPLFLGFLSRKKINVMIIFTLLGIIAIGTFTLLN
jgi:hypothetical protein